MPPATPFQFITCQRGVEAQIKADLLRERPDWKFAFSRPGFLTFKYSVEPSSADTPSQDKQDIEKHADDLRSSTPFARGGGWSLGKIQAASIEEQCAAFWDLVSEEKFAALHVWQRDTQLPDRSGFDPSITSIAKEAAAAIAATAPSNQVEWADPIAINQIAGRGQRVIDCILVDKDLWWVGWHRADRIESRWPGGVPDLQAPANMVSRAYLKMAEALAWSRLPVTVGDRIVEIGSAPGGASQCLLDRGLKVMGVDPAEMDPAVAKHENFIHVRKRGADVKRAAFRPFRWLAADMSLVPSAALDVVESIVTHRQVKIRGLLLTLKLRDSALADQVPAFLARIRSWGYREVRARQLGHNRSEICVAALQSRSLRRIAKRRQTPAVSQSPSEG